MKRKRYPEEKIIAMLKEVDAGVSVPDLSRRPGVAKNTIYRWKSKSGGMEISQATRLRAGGGECQAQAPASGVDARQRVP